MNGMELTARLSTLSTEELRKLWTAGVRDLGWTTQKAMNYLPNVERDSSALDLCRELVWFIYCERRVFTKTGKKILWRAHTANGRDRMIDETTCSWDESNAAVERIFAAVGK